MRPFVRGVVLSLALGLATGGGAEARCADFVPGPKPQNSGRDIVGQDLETIIARGFIEFAAYEDHPPYSYRAGGQPAGVDIEIGRLIADDLGVEPRFQLVAAGENLDADLRNYVWKGPVIGGHVSNVMLRVPFDPEFACRVEQVVFTGQYAKESIAIAFDNAAYPENPPVPAYFRFDPVAVENDSIADFYLSSLAGGQLRANIRHFPTARAAMAALEAGEVKAVMGARAQLESGLSEGLGLHQPPLPGLHSGSWTLGLAVGFSHRPLSYAVDDAVARGLADGRIAGIYQAHGLTYVPPER